MALMAPPLWSVVMPEKSESHMRIRRGDALNLLRWSLCLLLPDLDGEGLARGAKQGSRFGPHEGGALGLAIDHSVDSDVAEHPLGLFELNHPDGVIEASPHDACAKGVGDATRDVVTENGQRGR